MQFISIKFHAAVMSLHFFQVQCRPFFPDFLHCFSIFMIVKTASRKRVLVMRSAMIPITWLKEEENETRITQKIKWLQGQK